MTESLTDKQRFLEFQSYLSEETMELWERLILDNQFLDSAIIKILAYGKYIQSFPSAHYDNDVTEKSFAKLNKNFRIFENALGNSTAPHPSHKARMTLSKVPEVKEELIKSFSAFNDAFWNFVKLARGEVIKAVKANTVKRLIMKDNMTCIFYYNKMPIEFANPTNIYAVIFRILFDECDANGFCSYKTIENGLRKNKKSAILDEKKQIVRISNAVKYLFRYARNLPEQLPDGQPIITKKWGKGLILHNPEKK